MLRFCALSSLYVLLIALTPSAMLAAEANADHFQMNRDIRIQPDDEVGDVTCLNCSVYVLGRVSGAAVGGGRVLWALIGPLRSGQLRVIR